MSTNDDLSSAFGRPARNLSTLLTPNPRRGRREDADTAESAPPDHEDSASGESTSPEADEPTAPAPRSQPAPAAEDAPNAHGYDIGAGADPTPTTTARGDAAPVEAPSPTGTPSATPPAARGSGRGRRQNPRSKPSGSRNGPSTLDPDTSYQIGVYVHPYARTAAITRRKTDKVTNAEIVFDAIDAVQHRLEVLVRERRHQARPESSLFPGRVRRGRLAGGGAATLEGDARRVLWQFRANGAELEVIDRLVERSGAESRSELVAVALETTLLS